MIISCVPSALPHAMSDLGLSRCRSGDVYLSVRRVQVLGSCVMLHYVLQEGKLLPSVLFSGSL